MLYIKNDVDETATNEPAINKFLETTSDSKLPEYYDIIKMK